MEDLISQVSKKDSNGILHFHTLIDGCWQCLSSGRFFDVHNPATGELVARVPDCDPDDVRNAVAAAKKGRALGTIPPIRRLEIMEKARELVLENAELLARMITLESGKPMSVSRGEVKATAERLELTMEETHVLNGEYIPGEWGPDTKDRFAIVLRRPVGVVASISPFNYPLFIAAAKIIPAILAGNTVVAKPASDTPLSLILFVRILELAGIPSGAINIITGRGREIGDLLVSHPDVNAVSFTGSTSVGEHIASIAGIKKLHLELGGKASAIILADADLDRAAAAVCRGAFRNSGQRCDAVSRVIVEESVHDALLERIIKESAKYITGDPLNDKTEMGTVINEKAVARIQGLVDDAATKGALLVKGGRSDGLFYEATILDRVTTDMRIAWEEIFGPVLPVMTVRNAAEALEISNRSEFGLDSCVFTQDIDKALALARELHDGSVTINGMPQHGVGHFPFGGNKKSGIGREGIRYSIDELTELHTIIVATDPKRAGI